MVLATGYRPHRPTGCACRSLRRGRLDRAVPRLTAGPGLYVVGQRFQHRRDSSFIDGARHDARPSSSTCLAGPRLAAERTLTR